ncbi:MAG: competence protein ComEC [Yoonia sp.]|jgi:competence protein ComEC
MISDALLAQPDNLFGWIPVCLGTGIGLYFTLGQEPSVLIFAVGGLIGLALLVLARLASTAIAPLILAGAGLVKWRVGAVSAPVLTFRNYGPIEGHLANIDRSASDAVRLTLDNVVLARMSPDRTPAKVRIS